MHTNIYTHINKNTYIKHIEEVSINIVLKISIRCIQSSLLNFVLWIKQRKKYFCLHTEPD